MRLTLLGRWAGTDGRRWARLQDYFRYQGLWSPGVRLMRDLPMQAKATLIALAFVLPTGSLTTLVALHEWAKVRQIDVELAAARHGDAFLALARRTEDLGLALALRRPLDTGAPGALGDATRELLSALEGRLDSEALKAAQRQWRALNDVAPQDTERLGSAVAGLSVALRDLHLALIRQSGLANVEDERIGALVTVGLLEGPALQREIRWLQTQAAESLQPSSHGAADRRATLIRALALVERALGSMQAARRDLADGPPAGLLDRQLTDVQALLRALDAAVTAADAPPDMDRIDRLAATAHQSGLEVQDACNRELSETLTAHHEEAWQAAGRWAAFLGALLAVAVYLLVCFIRVLDGGVSALKQQVRRLADGDLTHIPNPLGKDDVAVVMKALGEALTRLSDLLSAVRQGAGGVNFAAQEVAQGSGSLSRRTEATHASMSALLQSLEASLVGLNEARQRTLDGQLAVQALRKDSLESRRHMQDLAARMSALQEKSRDIGEIVHLIDGIAHRTNILALNASVEAAKAGAAGRGFAVVAQEVRTLAERSAHSARRISEIVEGSTRDIADGHALTARAGESLAGSAAHLEDVHAAIEHVVQIGRDSQQTAQTYIAQVRELQSHSDDNRKLVRQMSDAADGLQRQSDRLARKVDSYRMH